MNNEVAGAVEELRRAFSPSKVIVTEDGSGGAYVIVEQVSLGVKFAPNVTWMGGHIPPQYPYADIYPIFIDAAVRRSDGQPFQVPVTAGAAFANRPALQVSRRNNQIHAAPQTAVAKFNKVLDFLEKLP
jgi:hypothetical protein